MGYPRSPDEQTGELITEKQCTSTAWAPCTPFIRRWNPTWNHRMVFDYRWTEAGIAAKKARERSAEAERRGSAAAEEGEETGEDSDSLIEAVPRMWADIAELQSSMPRLQAQMAGVCSDLERLLAQLGLKASLDV